jgi:hypothetical protein
LGTLVNPGKNANQARHAEAEYWEKEDGKYAREAYLQIRDNEHGDTKVIYWGGGRIITTDRPQGMKRGREREEIEGAWRRERDEE